MGRSSKQPKRHHVVTKLPKYSTGDLLVHARAIVAAMTKNPVFPSPRPPLTTVRAAIDALDAAQTATLTRAVGTVANRNAKRDQLKQQIEQLAMYVQVIADAQPETAASIIEGAAMSVKRVGGKPGRVFAAKCGRVSGEAILVAPRAGERAAYE
ncbi:MAG: hypothetical protein ABSE49_07605 [Polyangiaceae bacterium]|jgi:hypothetical protein